MLYPQLMPRKRADALGIPYEPFLDLALTLVQYIPGNLKAKYVERKQDFHRWKPEALKNLQNDPVRVMNLNDIAPNPGENIHAWVLTNSHMTFGASRMLQTDLFHLMSISADSDLLILPSSVHEIIVRPETDFTEERLERENKAVQMVNDRLVRDTDLLSDHVYVFRRGTGWEMAEK